MKRPRRTLAGTGIPARPGRPHERGNAPLGARSDFCSPSVPKAATGPQEAEAALSTSTDTPGPMVELSEIFVR